MSARELRFAAILISVSAIASRLLGFVREIVMAALLGAGAETDAYHAAFFVPDIINHFLAGGALSAALLPIMTQRLAEERQAELWSLVTAVCRVAAAVLAVAMVAAWFTMPTLIRAQYPGFDEAQVALTTRLTRIILPGPLFFTLGAVLNASEQARRRFWATAATGVIYNTCIICGGLIGHPYVGVEGFSWGVIVGVVVGPFLIPLIASWDVSRFRHALPVGHPDMRRVAHNAAPILLSSSLIFFDEWLQRHFASAMDAGAITWLNNARRLMLLPIAIVGQAIGQAAFPFLASARVTGDHARSKQTLLGVLHATTALSVVAAMGVWTVASPLVHAAFRRGAYTLGDAAQTSALLQVLVFAIPAWCLYTVALKALHAAERTWLSSGVGLVTLVPSYVVYGWFAADGPSGLAAATAWCISIATLVMLTATQRVYEVSPWLRIARGLVEGGAVSAAGWGAAWGANAAMGGRIDATGGSGAWIALAAQALAFGLAALAALVAMPGPAGEAIRRRLRR